METYDSTKFYIRSVDGRSRGQNYNIYQTADRDAMTVKRALLVVFLCEKYLQHQQDLYHVFTDFKKAFDRVWHAALWATMKNYNISTNLIQVTKNLYIKTTSAVLFNSSIADWFQTTDILVSLQSNRDVYSHPPFSTYLWKGL